AIACPALPYFCGVIRVARQMLPTWRATIRPPLHDRRAGAGSHAGRAARQKPIPGTLLRERGVEQPAADPPLPASGSRGGERGVVCWGGRAVRDDRRFLAQRRATSLGCR